MNYVLFVGFLFLFLFRIHVGNYVFFDVGQSRWSPPESKDGWLVSEVFPATDPNGLCLAFQYNIYGLGVDSLQILLIYNVESEKINSSTGEEVNKIIGYDTAVLWERNDTTNGEWQPGHLTFTSQTSFQVGRMPHFIPVC